MDSRLEYLFDIAENELQKKIIQVILDNGLDKDSISELINYIERGVE